MVITVEEKQKLYAPYIEILRDCRLQNGLSQADLAKESGLSSKYVTLIEKGKRVPSVESLMALMADAGVLRATAEELFNELANRFMWQG